MSGRLVLAVVWLSLLAPLGACSGGGAIMSKLDGVVALSAQPNGGVNACKLFIHQQYQGPDNSLATVGTGYDAVHIDSSGTTEQPLNQTCVGATLRTTAIQLADGGLVRAESNGADLVALDSGVERWRLGRSIKSLSEVVDDHLFVGGSDDVLRVRLTDGAIEWQLRVRADEDLAY